jgi:hypothetical protein
VQCLAIEEAALPLSSTACEEWRKVQSGLKFRRGNISVDRNFSVRWSLGGRRSVVFPLFSELACYESIDLVAVLGVKPPTFDEHIRKAMVVSRRPDRARVRKLDRVQ